MGDSTKTRLAHKHENVLKGAFRLYGQLDMTRLKSRQHVSEPLRAFMSRIGCWRKEQHKRQDSSYSGPDINISP